jgi:hypothetical protein
MNTAVLIKKLLQMDLSLDVKDILQSIVMFQWATCIGANNWSVVLPSYHLTAVTTQYSLPKSKSWPDWMVATKLDHLLKESVQPQTLILTDIAHAAWQKLVQCIYQLLKSSLFEHINRGVAKIYVSVSSSSLNDQSIRPNLYAKLNNFTCFINGNLPVSEQKYQLSVCRAWQLVRHHFSAVSLARYLCTKTDAAHDNSGISPIMR